MTAIPTSFTHVASAQQVLRERAGIVTPCLHNTKPSMTTTLECIQANTIGRQRGWLVWVLSDVGNRARWAWDGRG